MFHRPRHSHITVPNGGNSKLMRTRKIRPYRKGGGSGGVKIPANVLELENGHILRNVYDASDLESIVYGGGTTGNPDEIAWTSTEYADMQGREPVLANVWDQVAGDPIVPTPNEITDGRWGIAMDRHPGQR